MLKCPDVPPAQHLFFSMQHMCLSQQPSLAFHPAPSVGAGAGYAQPMQQPLPLSQLDPLLQASQHQASLYYLDQGTTIGQLEEWQAVQLACRCVRQSKFCT